MTKAMHQQRRAFTLVELLVVIAIIGVLVALLLPALSSARAAANASGSSSNIAGFGRGFELFATNNDGLYTTGAFDHHRDGDIRDYGWVADLIGLKVANPGKALDLGSRNKISEKCADYMGASKNKTTSAADSWSAAKSGKGSDKGGKMDSTVAGALYFGTGTNPNAARDVWNAGYNSNYATTWHFSRGDPSATDGYASGSKAPDSGDGGLTQNHLNQGLTTAARVALMGPARAGDGSDALVGGGSEYTPATGVGAVASVMNAFAGKTIVKTNDLLVEAFNDGMNVDFGTALGGAAGQKVHEFGDIEPLHQPKNSNGTGGFAPILFADGHVEKVVDTVTYNDTTGRGDGFIGNGVGRDGNGKITSVVIDAPTYQEISEQIWIKRLRNRQSAAGSVNENEFN
jgi:prepilin-type N-terminal cleavage/methylation domain-containing protein/prepilin-type processing-associated H-X9-DG protein